MSFPRLAWWIDGSFIPALMTLREFVLRKLLPAFHGLEEEVERVRSETLERLSAYADPDVDFADLGERAYDAGITYYEQVTSAHQGILNLFAVAIYHQFEQQQITLVRRELIFDGTEDDQSRMNAKAFAQILAQADIDIRSFSEWEKLNELRLVANVAKHAEGPSASELEKIRPDMFVSPAIRDYPPFIHRSVRRRIFQPMSGDDLYVTPQDLEAYFEATLGFWRRLSNIVQSA